MSKKEQNDELKKQKEYYELELNTGIKANNTEYNK